MKKHFLLACLLMAMGGVYPDVVNAQCGDNGDGTFSNPVFWTDVPDPDVIRVGDDFYMVSTTMHLVPGAPIMHSKDLVNWEIVSYLYDRLDDKPNYDLKEGLYMDVASGLLLCVTIMEHIMLIFLRMTPLTKDMCILLLTLKRDGHCRHVFLIFMMRLCFLMTMGKLISFMVPDSCVN